MSATIIHNAHILSFQEGFRKDADTLVLNGNRIEAVGRLEEFEPLVHAGGSLKDAGGKTLMPGLNDTHIHIWKVGNLKTGMLDVRAARSLEEMLSMLEVYLKKYPELAWVTARGFNEAGWKEGRMPNRKDLDKVIAHKPVYVIRTCAHIAVANTRALELCDIHGGTRVPEGGVMYTDSGGQPNGIFSETALGLISRHIPPYSKEELKQMVLAAREEMYQYGITAATDPAVDPLLLEAYYEMHAAGELGFRLNAIPILLPDGGANPYPVPQKFSSDFFRVNTVKFFSDGGLSGKTAALKKTYKGSQEQGVLRLKKDQYLELCRKAMNAGLGIATHAIGDAAIEFVIENYKELHLDFPGQINRIEHLGLPSEKNLADMAAHAIAASMQTIFITELGKNFIKYLEPDYLDQCYPVRSALHHGILTALSSDAPVVKNFNPFQGAQAAVTRTDDEGHVIAPHESISVIEALKAYTHSAAAISGTPDWGSLEKGKLADFILLDKNPLEVPSAEISSIRVEKTYVDGQLVYERT